MNRITYNKLLTIMLLAVCLIWGIMSTAHAFRGMGQDGSNANPETMGSSNVQGLPPDHTGSSETIVALVNGTEITMGELMHTVKDVLMRKYRNMQLTEELAQRIRYQALEELALEELAFQHAKTIGITVEQTEIEERLEELTRAEGGEDALKISLAQRNKTVEDLKEDIGRFFAVKKAIAQEINSQVIVSDNEINEVYEANRQEFITPERVVVTDIIFFLDPEVPASVEKVRSIREQIISELDNDPTKLEQSGFVVSSGINVSPDNKAELYNTVQEMKTGEISPPVVLDGTLHLVKFDSYRPQSETPQETAKAIIAQKLKTFKKRQLLTKWRQNLLKQAEIKIVHDLLKEYNPTTSQETADDAIK